MLDRICSSHLVTLGSSQRCKIVSLKVVEKSGVSTDRIRVSHKKQNKTKKLISSTALVDTFHKRIQSKYVMSVGEK